MAATYDITTDVGKVRLMTGDKDLTSVVFSDEEITYFLTEAGSVELASAMLLEAWAALYTASPSAEKIGDYSYSAKTVDNMLALAAKLRAKVAGVPYLTWGEMDLISLPSEDD